MSSSSTSNYMDVQWIPGLPDRLVTCSTQIKLYRLLESHSLAELESEIRDPPNYIKCAAVTPTLGDVTVAVGTANGRISLLCFRQQGVIQEWGPRGRICNGLSWNNHGSFLASGYDKNKNDPSIYVFDIKSGSSTFETAFAESCSSLCWICSNSLVGGLNGKSLRISDIRSTNTGISTSTRAVFGVCVDPFVSTRISSHVDHQVVIWDTRNFDKPIVTHFRGRKVTKLSWCPTRSGLLCSITDNDSRLLLHDIQSWAVMNEDGEPAVTVRSVPLDETIKIASFAWHPKIENTLVAVNHRGKLSETIVVSERIAPSWSSRHSLCWPQSGILRFFDDSELFTTLEDMSYIMQKRALQGYGISYSHNASLISSLSSSSTSSSSSLECIWNWLESQKNKGYQGVKTILSQSSLSSLIEYRKWNGVDSSNKLRPRVTYVSESREKAIVLCGWTCGSGASSSELNQFTESLEKNGQVSRASAIALFCCDLRLALVILQRGSIKSNSETLRMVAMALSGFTEDKSGLWHEIVSGSSVASSDPYLQVMFSFLLNTDKYTTILNSEISLADKLAFSLLYSNDINLHKMIHKCWEDFCEEGNLEALLLSGMCSSETLDLLQKYVDLTGDVQSASWMVATCIPSEFAVKEAPQTWIESYRELLNMWCLWSYRAELDIALSANQVTKKPVTQVYVSCNYCGRCIGQHVKGGMPTPSPLFKQQQQQQQKKSSTRLQVCPACRKPLPRCAVCLINMGTMSGLNIQTSKPNEHSKKISPFQKFFTWCQSCRHGGHALHILEWFKEHFECPVSGCVCKCKSLDASVKLENIEAFKEANE